MVTGEMFWLALTVGLCLIIWIPYTALYGGIVGVKSGTTDVPPTAKLPDWAQRCHRAHMNLIETLIPFATLVIMIKVLGKSDAATAIAAATFFGARVVHVVVYTMGVPFLRTPAFAVSWLACLYLLWQILG
ncbi:MAG: MAPEG family protein [Alphaproteobacteria bacterium]|nr:MAPEG family protein [Alphaproteobacteria bacterium]